MSQHLRANLWLLLFTLVLCSIVYPAILWVIGQTAFADKAQGSMMFGPDKRPIGSRLIAQPFSGPEYFRPRPSAVDYNAAASGASNWGASNYRLRERVARTIAAIVKYRDGRPAGPDIEKWFAERPERLTEWAIAHPSVAKGWGDIHAELIDAWRNEHREAVAEGAMANTDQPAANPTIAYLKSLATKQTRSRPKGNDDPLWSVLFEAWLEAHPHADLEPVPADMLMASASGLDPHITLKNALYQLDRVSDAWAKKLHQDPARIRKEIEGLLHETQESPLGGWFGVPLVNVIEINLKLANRLAKRP
jgi:K+-transporting ATPase ATPase C chain